MKSVFLFVFALLASTVTASAGELSKYDVTGFSADGRFFAFEEFGVGDGAGIPYASLFVIDVENDRWLSGAPVKTNFDEDDVVSGEGLPPQEVETRAIALAREDVRSRSQALLSQLGTPVGGIERVAHPPYDFTDDARLARFSMRGFRLIYNTPLTQPVWRILLQEREFAAPERCRFQTENIRGFSLTLKNETTGTERILAQDNAVPRSRGCALSYHIEKVITHDLDNNRFALAVLVRFAKVGFEGPDGRLLAVTALIER